MNAAIPPLHLVLQAAPDAPGAAELLGEAEVAVASGHEVAVLLVDGGLAWREDARLARLAEASGVRVRLCSRSAREQGLDPQALPPWIAWSSLIAFFRDHDPGQPLWGLFP